ncbi:MAG: PLP-dependent aminotransferase family protein [Candidatus Eisenbacteria sp.]|nr:PLP-dependent aminotransferase family protein [Candidatus Eisenbacteria bacterium]
MDERFSHLYAGRAREIKASIIRELLKMLLNPDIISFAGGWPDVETFPSDEMIEIATDVFRNKAGSAFQYGTSEGLAELREALAARAREREGIKGIDPDNILIASGSQQAMELAGRLLIDAGDVLLVGLPTYFGATGAFKIYRAHLDGVPVDGDGMQMDVLEEKVRHHQAAGRRVKMVYVQTNFHNPMGVTLTLERRKRLLELAETYDFIVMEDNPYGDLRYSGEPIPSLMALDSNDRVIYACSFSKILCPGIRLAWVAGESALIRKMVVTKQFVDLCTNTISQHLLSEFIHRGYLDKRIELNIRHYRAKRDLMLEMLDKYFPSELIWTRPQGGFFIFVTLPEHLDAGALLKEAIGKEVVFVAGQPFFLDGSGRNTMRLSFTGAPADRIEEGIRRLGELIKSKV